eukprot:1142689-Pelagomonas_calceolata.AAC.1
MVAEAAPLLCGEQSYALAVGCEERWTPAKLQCTAFQRNGRKHKPCNVVLTTHAAVLRHAHPLLEAGCHKREVYKSVRLAATSMGCAKA